MKYIDLHCDALTKEGVACVTAENLRAGGCALQCFAAFVDGTKGEGYERAIALCDRFDAMCRREPAFRTSGGIAAVLTVEGGEALGGSLENLEVLFSRGVRMLGLTWNRDNEIGSCGAPHPTLPPWKGGRQERAPAGERRERAPAGERQERAPAGGRQERAPAGERQERAPAGGRQERAPAGGRQERAPAGERQERAPAGERQERAPAGERREKGGGLTKFGRECVERMCGMGMLADVAHGSDGLLSDVAEICKKRGVPFVVSHAGAREVFSHPRNLADGGIRAVAESGGAIGLYFVGKFLSADRSAEGQRAAILAHARHILKVGGEDVLALGSDFDGAAPNAYVGSPAEVPKLLLELEKAFGGRVAEKIAFKNALRVLGRVQQ